MRPQRLVVTPRGAVYPANGLHWRAVWWVATEATHYRVTGALDAGLMAAMEAGLIDMLDADDESDDDM